MSTLPKRSFLAELQRRHVYKVGAMYCVAAWLLAQIVTQILPVFDVSALGQRILVLLLIAGFPVALILAWLFDLTPQGIVRTEDLPAAGESQAASRERRGIERKLNYVLGLLIIAGVGYFVAERAGYVGSANSAAQALSGDQSIAVLPLANSTGDPANEYFSDGVSEELISSLSRLSHLKVIGRTSSFQFKNKSDDSRAIGDKLGVGYLLEGSVRKSAERVRIAVELVRSADGADVWSQTYDRELKDIFAVQSEIASSVAEQLQVPLFGNNAKAAAAPTPATPSNQNLAAYTALLQGNYYARLYSLEDGHKAVAYYQEAIRLDPAYALAYALASFNGALTAENFAGGPNVKAAALVEAHVAAQQALKLAPNLAEAHSANGYLLENADFDLAGAAAEYQRAYELAPQDANNLGAQSFQYLLSDDFEQAVTYGERAVAVDPLFLHARLALSIAQLAAGQYDDAERTLRKSIELQPQAAQNYELLAIIAILRGDSAQALRLAAQETNPFWQNYALALAHAAHGDKAEADAQLRTLIEKDPDEAASQIAMVYALRNDPDEMFKWLAHGAETRDPGTLQLYANPFLRRYQGDPRFAVLCRQLGLPLPVVHL